MGRGSSTKQVGVVKKRPSEISSFGGSYSSDSSDGTADSCLFSLTVSLKTVSGNAQLIAKGDSVVLVPDHNSPPKIEIYIKTYNFGEYKGKKLQKILDCVQQGYFYEGTVESVVPNKNDSEIVFSVQGRKK